MGKKLSEMSLEELWQLFPIFLTEHKSCWKEWYNDEEFVIKKMLPQISRISHVGSTAVSSIWAKPIIDILIEVPRKCNLLSIKDILVNNGYICMSQGADRISLNKGYTENGFAERVFHLHLRYAGDNDELYFRDYLIENVDIAKEYEGMKLTLWKQFEHDRDGYTNAKKEFVKKYTDEAKAKYGNRWGDSMVEFRKFTEFPRGTLYDILQDAYSFDSRNKEIWDENWHESDDFFYDNPYIADHFGLVTCIDGEPIGFVTWDPRHRPEYVEIGHNGIREKYKGKGYGRMQLEEAIRRIREYEGLKRIIVSTNSNLVAPRNYESVGFKLYDRKSNNTESAYTGDYLYYEMKL